MKNEIEQGLHEKLCAFILGEASEELRAEVERALAESAELRAERARIESTIGLVQATMGGSEELPRSAREILADAQPPRGRPWHRTTGFKIAAGFAAMAITGVIASRTMDRVERDSAPFTYRIFGGNEEPAPMPREATAQSKRGFEKAQDNAPMPAAAEGGDKLAFQAGEKLGTGGGKSAAEVIDRAPDHSNSTAIGTPSDQPDPRASLTVESLERLDALGNEEARDEKGIAGLGFKQEDEQAEMDRRLKSLGYVDSSVAAKQPRVEDGLVSGSDNQLLGRGESVGGAARALPPAGGSGDRAAGPSTIAPSASGPSTGGPAGPGSPAPVLDGVYYGWRKAGAAPGEAKDGSVVLHEEQARGALKGLGYAGGDYDHEGHDDDFFLGQRNRQLSPVERDRWIEDECRRIILRCRPRPNERPRDMFFRFYGDNPFELAAIDPLSTFSIDVDTASYTLARRYLNEGHIPQKAQIRTEEFVNYFKADVAAPTEGTFAIHTDLTPSRFSSDRARSMLRVVVRGREVAKEERQPLNITFVIDTSGSMKEQNRLELVKHAVRLLANELGANDALAIVAFSTDARMILPMTSASQKGVIESAIFPLRPDGSTNASAGLRMGYEEALARINPNGQNRVVLLSDGVANTGQTHQNDMTRSVQLHREKGIYLNTIGVGMNNHNDALLEQLADKGDGICSYVDSPDEARKAIVDRFTGAFETIARDVKIQVDFDPAQVERYRLLGYENRAIADKDFRNDAIDAGEVGAGHQVTALYEIERAAGASEKPFATVRVRWKAPRNVNAPTANEEATEIEKPVLASQQTGFEGAGVGYRRAAVVAQFAEFLRRSVHARGDSLDDLIAEADKLVNETGDPETAEFVRLVHKSKQLILNALPSCDDLCQTIESVRRNALLRCQEELLAKEGDAKLLEDLEAENRKLEERIRGFLRRQVESREK